MQRKSVRLDAMDNRGCRLGGLSARRIIVACDSRYRAQHSRPKLRTYKIGRYPTYGPQWLRWTAEMATCAYELIDFGRGRKLERFGHYLLDRPDPAAADFEPAKPACWKNADFRFRQDRLHRGRWHSRRPIPDPWEVEFWFGRLTLTLSPAGQVGMFPDQIANWNWLRRLGAGLDGMKLLNLFASTGGTTMALAALGAQVVHVDGARNVVARARNNADRSCLQRAKIRWITEDALKFVRREVRRQNHYDGVVLDPPSYGHGPRNEPWKINAHFDRLLMEIARLVGRSPELLLLTCHSPGYDHRRLYEFVNTHLAFSPLDNLHHAPLSIETADGRRLPSGAMVRWPE